MRSDISLDLASILTEQVKRAFESEEMIEAVTPVTQDLLKYWFMEPYTEERYKNFHIGQKQSILNIIYLHEVLKITTVEDIYRKVAPDLLAECNLEDFTKDKYKMPKYAVKMATGTGKTWVMHALLLWQMLNARHEEERSGRYTQNFLIVAPGLIVYDRLKDAYCGRLKEGSSERDLFTNDLYQHKELFVPSVYQDEVFSFIQNNVVTKDDGIGRKITGNGLIAVTNWHLFLSDEGESDVESNTAPDIINDLLPIRPGVTQGNALEALDRRYLRGNELEYLADLPDLMVINDEAHHIHENKKHGEIEEVEWQKGLNKIAQNKGGQFFQIDFSATPYDTIGSGKRQKKVYFPHIITDFDLSQAMKLGLVKTLLLDRRQELTDLANLDYKAVREGRKVVGLSDGQRLMLRAGLRKLQILEDGFVKLDVKKHPKMLVICEDTNVTPFVESFLKEEGLMADDVLRIDSNAKGEVKEKDWLQIKERLFNIDKYESPKVIVSVLMLREGFDVNNICVVVPLRSTESAILLEQTVGRGLRLMWREPEYQDEKQENRMQVLLRKKAPKSYLDMLSIIEHPKFIDFYNDLMNDGLAATDERELSQDSNVTGDIIKVGLKDNYADYDLFWPLIIKDQEQEIKPSVINIDKLAPFTDYTYEQLKAILAKPGESFISQVVKVGTQFGKYEVNMDLCNAQSYNEYLQKVLRIVTTRFDKTGKNSVKQLPTIQINQQEIIKVIDIYIRTRLFSRSFNPFENYNWKILLQNEGIATQHIVREITKAIYYMQEEINVTEAIVEKIYFSTIPTLRIRENYALDLEKTIYEKVAYPSNKGGFEKAFMEFLDNDTEVNSFIKINENQHRFASIYYIRQDGLLASYHPDFTVSTDSHIYIIETKGQEQIHNKNVRQKQLATIEWCKKINSLKPYYRMNRIWEYILLGENDFYGLKQNGANITEICELHKISERAVKGSLF